MSICKLIESCKHVNQEELAKMFIGLMNRNNQIINHYQLYCIHDSLNCTYNNKIEEGVHN